MEWREKAKLKNAVRPRQSNLTHSAQHLVSVPQILVVIFQRNMMIKREKKKLVAW